MFKKLRDKWGVSAGRVFLILCTFAIGGSLSGRAAHKLLNLAAIDNTVLWILAYLLMVTILWPISVLLVSIPFGQFPFFKKYLARMGRRIVSRKGDNNARFPVAA